MWMPFEYWIADHLNAEQMDTILLSYVLVQYKNGGSNTLDKAPFEDKVQKVFFLNTSPVSAC